MHHPTKFQADIWNPYKKWINKNQYVNKINSKQVMVESDALRKNENPI